MGLLGKRPQRILGISQHWHSESDTLLINAVY